MDHEYPERVPPTPHIFIFGIPLKTDKILPNHNYKSGLQNACIQPRQNYYEMISNLIKEPESVKSHCTSIH